MIGEIIIISFLVILLLPVTIKMRTSRKDGRIDGVFELTWLIFLFSFSLKGQTEFKIFQRQVVLYRHKEKHIEVKKGPHKLKKMRISYFNDAFNLLRPMLILLKDLINCFGLKHLDIDVRFGANDPSHTGIMAGLLYAMDGFFKKGHNITWAADFEKPILEWNVIAEVAIIPVRIFPPIMRFITNRQVLRSGFRIIRA